MNYLTREFYTPEQAADLLQVHVNTIYRLGRQRVFDYYKVGAQIRIPAAELDRLKVERIDNAEHKKTGPKPKKKRGKSNVN